MSQYEFGKYRLIAELGSGGMADVFLAVGKSEVDFNKLLVLKKLRRHLGEDPEFVRMLLDEARIAARFNHPNVVQTVEAGQVDGTYFLAMEFLEGQPYSRIAHRVSTRKVTLPDIMHYRILADVLAGLHHAHELTEFDGTPLEVVHRDVSPHNVFVTYTGQVKLMDFGIAKAIGRETETSTGIIKGKMTYMAPEQAAGLEVDRRADIFSVGILLWEAAVGRRLWKGLQEVAIMHHLIDGNIPSSPAAVNPQVPAAIDAICRRALATRPEGRYATAAEMQNDIEEYLGTRGDHVSARDLGALVTSLFDDKRSEIKRVILQQLSNLKTKGPQKFETVLINSDSAGVASGPPSTFTPTSPSPSEPDEHTAATLVGPSGSGVMVGGRKRFRMWLLVAGAGMAAAVGWLLVARNGRSQPGAEGPPASAQVESSTPSGSATAEPAATPPKEISVRLRASPASARFRIDDGSALSNPYEGRVPRDNKVHQVRVEASGYATKTVDLSFNDDVVVDLSLTPQSRAGRPAPTTATPLLPTAPTTTKPIRPVDEGDPWRR